jgi:LCP family protein required for cell wall assembly
MANPIHLFKQQSKLYSINPKTMTLFDPNPSQPANPWAETRPQEVSKNTEARPSWVKSPRRRRPGCCCGMILLGGILMILLIIWVYAAAPGRTNILILGLDSRELGSNLGRSDTMILTTILPSEPYVGMLSMPRDLWVTIPNYGANRINAAHFLAEADQPGSGPMVAMDTVRTNFGVDVDYFVRVRFDSFLDLVDALGGVEIELPRPMSGYTEGSHHLDGEQALAFVRDRAGSDDFFRMERGQIFLKALIKRFLSFSGVRNLPQTIGIIAQMVDTDVPFWLWPRVGIAFLRVGPEGIDNRIISREMVNPFTTEGGAQVLAPNWAEINPVLMEIFGQ